MVFLKDWGYSKIITVAGAKGAGINYPILFFVGDNAGSIGADFHVEGKSKIFPSDINKSGDIRFTNSNKTTLLKIFVESVSGVTPNRIAKIWVRIEDDLENNINIYCYYGFSGANNVSDEMDTFVNCYT